MVTVYLSLFGSEGLKELALYNRIQFQKITEILSSFGFVRKGAVSFHEGVFYHPEGERIRNDLKKNNFLLGFPLRKWDPSLSDHLLICATEIHDEESFQELKECLRKVV